MQGVHKALVTVALQMCFMFEWKYTTWSCTFFLNEVLFCHISRLLYDLKAMILHSFARVFTMFFSFIPKEKVPTRCPDRLKRLRPSLGHGPLPGKTSGSQVQAWTGDWGLWAISWDVSMSFLRSPWFSDVFWWLCSDFLVVLLQVST